MSDLYLRPCPFCGGKAELKVYRTPQPASYVYVRCRICGSRTRDVEISMEYSSDEVAAKLWNSRAERKRSENVIKLYKLRFEEYEIIEGGDEKLIRGDVAEKHVIEHEYDMNTDQDVYDELEEAVRKARFPLS